MIGANYVNGLGEDMTSPVYSEFTDELGRQFVVVGGRIGGTFEILPREDVQFMTYDTNYEMEPVDQPLPEQMAKLARMQIQHALEECGGNKTKAAEMLGLPSYQTLSNWMDKYGIDG